MRENMSYIEELGEKAKIASKKLLTLDTKTKKEVLTLYIYSAFLLKT